MNLSKKYKILLYAFEFLCAQVLNTGVHAKEVPLDFQKIPSPTQGHDILERTEVFFKKIKNEIITKDRRQIIRRSLGRTDCHERRMLAF